MSGLLVHHASWDSDTSTLIDLDTTAVENSKTTLISEPKPAEMPVIWLKPLLTTELDAIRAKQEAALYPCPVYGTVRHASKTGSQPVMVTVEVPTVQRTPGHWTMQRVYMSTKLTPADLDIVSDSAREKGLEQTE